MYFILLSLNLHCLVKDGCSAEQCKETRHLFLVAKPLRLDMGVELVHWLIIDIASQNFYSEVTCMCKP